MPEERLRKHHSYAVPLQRGRKRWSRLFWRIHRSTSESLVFLSVRTQVLGFLTIPARGEKFSALLPNQRGREATGGWSGARIASEAIRMSTAVRSRRKRSSLPGLAEIVVQFACRPDIDARGYEIPSPSIATAPIKASFQSTERPRGLALGEPTRALWSRRHFPG